MAKELTFEADAREAILRGVEKLSRAVVSTMGPKGKNAVLDRGWGGPNITKDGVTVAEEIELENAAENMGAKLVREAASKTSDVAGDGTTTATLLTHRIFEGGLRFLAAGANRAQLISGIQKGTKAIVENLAKQAKKIDPKDISAISQVGTISANNDKSVGDLFGTIFKKLGPDGVITLEEGKSRETSFEVVEGMQFDRGYLSPHFITDTQAMEVVLDNPYILIHEEKLGSVQKLLPILEQIMKKNTPLLVIAEDLEGEALATLVVNKMRGTLQCAAVKAPGYGDRRKAMLQDLAVLTGGEAIFKDLGIDLESIELGSLGRAKRVVLTNESTTILQGKGAKADIEARAAQIRREIENTTSDYDREKLQERLARLLSGVAVIRAGGATETEVKERKALLDDALHSTRAALEEGVLPGGGTAFLRAQKALGKVEVTGDEVFGIEILTKAIQTPLRQIAENAGKDGAVVVRNVMKEKGAYGYNALTDEYGDMFEMGIVDATKVTRSALQNAASVAALLLSTDAIVTTRPENDGDEDMDEDMDM